MKINDKKLIVYNKGFFGYLLFVFFILLVEYFNFFNYFAGNRLPSYFGDIFAAVIFLFLFIYLVLIKKKLSFIKNPYAKDCLLGALIIFLVCLLMNFYADNACDTFNYHLAAQNPLFENYFVDDYGYGNVQIWGFRLPNRLFYIFRLTLGYRLGTILNPIALVITYFGIYELLDFVFKQLNVNPKDSFAKLLTSKTIWGIALTLQFDSILMVGTYYVEALALPIAVEMLSFLLRKKNNYSWTGLCYLAFLSGLLIAFKMTNAIYVIPIVILYFVFNVKKSKFYHWPVALIIGVIPFALYLVFNQICTGNPVFPYFNNLFKSLYHEGVFQEMRWGGENFQEKLLWVFYAVFQPTYRQSEIPQPFNGEFAIGLLAIIFAIIIVIFRFKKVKENKAGFMIFFNLFFIALVSSLIWSFATGYSRYYIFGKMIFLLMGYWMTCYLSQCEWNLAYAYQLISYSSCFLITYYALTGFYGGKNWNFVEFSSTTFKEESSNIFKDRNSKEDSGIDPDMFFVTSQERQCIAELIDDKVFVFNATYRQYTDYQYYETLNRKLSECSNIYDIYDKYLYDITTYCDTLNSYSFQIDEIKHATIACGEFNFVKIHYNENAHNEAYAFENGGVVIPTNGLEGEYNLSFISARYFPWKSEAHSDLTVELYVNNADSSTYVSSFKVNTINSSKQEMKVDLKQGDYIYLKAYYPGGGVVTDDEANKLIVINPAFN